MRGRRGRPAPGAAAAAAAALAWCGAGVEAQQGGCSFGNLDFSALNTPQGTSVQIGPPDAPRGTVSVNPCSSPQVPGVTCGAVQTLCCLESTQSASPPRSASAPPLPAERRRLRSRPADRVRLRLRRHVHDRAQRPADHRGRGADGRQPRVLRPAADLDLLPLRRQHPRARRARVRAAAAGAPPTTALPGAAAAAG